MAVCSPLPVSIRSVTRCSRPRGVENSATLVLGDSAPDAVGFPESQGVDEALNSDGALRTEAFGFTFSLVSTESTFAVGMEEHRGVCPAAAGGELPLPRLGLCDDRRSRCGFAALLCSTLVCGPISGGFITEVIPCCHHTPRFRVTGQRDKDVTDWCINANGRCTNRFRW
jgi:hypothetical protein